MDSNSRRSDDAHGVWFFVEHQDGKVDDSSIKLASESRYLADKLGDVATAIIIGDSVKDIVSQFAPYGTDKAFIVEDPHLRIYNDEAYVDTLIQLVESEKPRMILLASSIIGNDLAPRLAARLQTALVARYTEIEVDKENNLTVHKAIHGGNAQVTVTPLKRPFICTIDTQTLSEQKVRAPIDTCIIDTTIRIDPKTSLTKVIDYLEADPCSVCVSEADIVIGVGKGLGCYFRLL
jgi:electron transfer flavoprotein alpha subunit